MALVSGFALVALLFYEPYQQPISGDRAYLIYVAQALYRGEPIYQTTTAGYTPLGYLFSAGAMHLGVMLGLPTYLAPRLLSLPISALSCGLLFLVASQATRNARIGLVAALSLLHIELFALLGTSNLEQKTLVQFAFLCATWAAQKRKWVWAGVAVALAAMVWQPALLGALAIFIVCLGNSRRRPANLLLYGSGLFLGTVPAGAYLILTGQEVDFVQQAVLFKILPRRHVVLQELTHPVTFGAISLSAVGARNLPLVVMMVGALLKFLRRGFHSVLRLSFSTRMGAIVWLTVLAAVYVIGSPLTGIEYNGQVDLLAFMYLPAFWGAWGWYLLFDSIVWRFKQRGVAALSPSVFMSVLAVSLAASVLLAASGNRIVEPLSAQEEFVRRLIAEGSESSPLAINADEFYVLSETRSPWRTRHVTPYFLDFMAYRERRECTDVLADLKQEEYSPVLIGSRRLWENPCLERILAYFRDGGEFFEVNVESTVRQCGTLRLVQAQLANRTWDGAALATRLRCVLEQSSRRNALVNYSNYTIFTRE